MLWQTCRTLWLNYPDNYTKIGFTGHLHLWWPLLLCRAIANRFHPPHTRLTLKRLKPLSCHRLGSPATLTTWVSLLYMRLTDPLEFRDAVLTWIHILIYTLHATIKSPHETHGITPISHQSHVSYLITTTCYLSISFSCTFSTNQNKISYITHANIQISVHTTHTTQAITP